MAQVLGVKQLLDRLATAAVVGELAARTARDTLGTDVAELARGEVAVDTGALQDTIDYADGVVTAGSSEVDYAGDVEYGTSDTPAQPFMRPAADTVDPTRAEHEAAAILGRI